MTSKTWSWGPTILAHAAFTEDTASQCSPASCDSKTAVKVNIEIVREFVRLRRLLATPGEFATQLQQLAETVQAPRQTRSR